MRSIYKILGLFFFVFFTPQQLWAVSADWKIDYSKIVILGSSTKAGAEASAAARTDAGHGLCMKATKIASYTYDMINPADVACTNPASLSCPRQIALDPIQRYTFDTSPDEMMTQSLMLFHGDPNRYRSVKYFGKSESYGFLKVYKQINTFFPNTENPFIDMFSGSAGSSGLFADAKQKILPFCSPAELSADPTLGIKPCQHVMVNLKGYINITKPGYYNFLSMSQYAHRLVIGNNQRDVHVACVSDPEPYDILPLLSRSPCQKEDRGFYLDPIYQISHIVTSSNGNHASFTPDKNLDATGHVVGRVVQFENAGLYAIDLYFVNGTRAGSENPYFELAYKEITEAEILSPDVIQGATQDSIIPVIQANQNRYKFKPVSQDMLFTSTVGKAAYCQQCNENDECHDGYLCRDGLCQPECETNAQCPAVGGKNRVCVQQKCESACDNNNDCQNGKICDQQTHQCIDPQCQTKADCPAGKVCYSNLCVDPPTYCGDDADCPVGKTCDINSHLCVSPCTKNADCPADKVCINQICSNPKPQCDNDNDCPVGKTCHLPTHTCLVVPTDCTKNTDCINGQICVNNKCQLPACVNDQDCQPGYSCQNNVCIKKPQSCTKNADCQEPLVCDQSTKTCQKPKPECAIDADCKDELLMCLNQKCVERACKNDNECPANQTCDLAQQKCVKKPTGGTLEVTCGGQICQTGETCDTKTNSCIKQRSFLYIGGCSSVSNLGFEWVLAGLCTLAVRVRNKKYKK